MDREEFNKYLDNLLVEAKVENEMSEFTKQINHIITQTEFDESKQAFLFISVDNIDKLKPDAFISYIGDNKGCVMLLQAIKNFTSQIKNDNEVKWKITKSGQHAGIATRNMTLICTGSHVRIVEM